MKNVLLFILVFPTLLLAQYRTHDANRIGIAVGTNQFGLYTSDLTVKAEQGWNAALSLRGNWYNNFDMVYGIQFSEHNFSTNTNTGSRVQYKLSSAQIFLTPSYKIIPDHLSIEFGPMVQINGDLTFDALQKTQVIQGTTVTVEELAKVSRFNFYPTIAITTGIKRLRVQFMYQYGINNLFSKSENINAKGGILAGNLIFYL